MKKNTLPKIAAVFFVSVFVLPSLTYSQSVWYGREKKNSINLEINKPVNPSDSLVGIVIPGVDTWSGSVFLSGRYSLPKNKNITFVADIPIAHGNIDDPIVSNGSETVFGNPYVGAEFDIPRTPIFFELGLRIPLVPDDKGVAKFAGVISDFDRSEAFFKDAVPVYAAVNYSTVSDNKILFSARGGLNLWFNSDTIGFQKNPEVLADYQLQTGYIDKNLNVIFSAVGRYGLSSTAARPQKSNLIQYGLSVVVPYKRIRPALSFRVPGNDLSSGLLNYVIGINFGYVFN